MRLALIAHTVGLVLRYFGLIPILPLVVDFLYGDWQESIGFAVAGFGASLAGEIMRRLHRGGADLSRVEGLAVVAAVWLVVAVFGAIPYVWSGLGALDSLFESMSGFTTTGATIIQDFGFFSRGIFFWRSLTQWLGGLGVIALFIAVLPKLAIAGRQLFFAEAPGPAEERLTPRIRQTAIALWTLYAALTLLQILLLAATGLPLYDAVCNSLATLSAGGFSPHPASIAGYASPAAEWIIILFMFLAGTNFSLQYYVLKGSPRNLLRDEEFRAYVIIVLVATLLLSLALYQLTLGTRAAYLNSETSPQPLSQAPSLASLRHALFQVLSILTSTGFASDDFNLWNDQAKMILLLLMFIGGSAGSAAGGPKIVRALLIVKHAFAELFKAVHPQAVKPVRLNNRVVSMEIMRSITAFLLLYLLVFAVSVLVIAAFGLDIITAITASIATLGNIGPGFGTIGPMANFGDLHPVVKAVLIFNMWIGRLEIMTVLVLLQPHVWKTARAGD
jgi:trk system potassium uptake protein TrkH